MCGIFIRKKYSIPLCPVCYSEITSIEIMLMISCGHVLCSKCALKINKYVFATFKLKCPLCRQSLKCSVYAPECKFKCVKCLFVKDKKKVHANCGHTYCFNCTHPLISEKEIRCVVCKQNRNIYPLFF
mgnify:CR=1 FL=1